MAGHMLHAVRSALQQQPYFLALDTTRKQLTAFGALYGKGSAPLPALERHRHRARSEQYREAAALFPWSKWCADSIVNDYGVDRERVHVIPPGVDLDYWRCGQRPNGGPLNLLFVGSHFNRKGGDMLMRWAKSTAAKDWQLHLVTRDPVATDDPRIHVHSGLAPNTTALRQLYQSADIFVLPTRGDCYSIAAIEAMAAGLPVVLARTGGTVDIIKEGQTGYLIDVGDQAALVDRLEHLIANPEQRLTMGAAARRDAEERYDVRTNIHETVLVMRKYLDHGRYK
jgi:glycosyltransferase involved in cell wall biosynthesis